MKPVIVDNFLEKNQFKEFQDIMMGQSILWSFNPVVVYQGEGGDNFQFVHLFYLDFAATSTKDMVVLEPILNILNPFSINRIKANLIPRTSTINVHTYHTDISISDDEEKLKQWKTSIFYVNTNNGYTSFEDGTIVNSVDNRLVTFPSNMKHAGSSCTDQKVRIVINFNYFK